ncbi:S8 family serine peptidase [Candidatus Lokiarchaeum ossiferum]|uniref:Loki-CTERM sorting domain-containing protein n=1 Tax=Candidatus Lokiarchaeum ossiferum TaxID=2951803 RepID=UPI00352DA3F9
MKVKNFSFSNARVRIYVLLGLMLFLLPLSLTNAQTTSTVSVASPTSEVVNALPEDITSVETLNLNKIDGVLTEWRESKTMPEGLTHVDKVASIMMLVAGDDPSLGGTVEVIGSAKLIDSLWVHAYVDGLNALDAVIANPNVLKIEGDMSLKTAPRSVYEGAEIERGVSPELLVAGAYDVEPDTAYGELLPVNISGSDDVQALGYDGDGVIVQVHDTGVDFGHTGLKDSMALFDDDTPMSLNPTGTGFSISSKYTYEYYNDTTRGNDTELSAAFEPMHVDADGFIDISMCYGYLRILLSDLGALYRPYQLGLELPDEYYVGDIAGNTTGFYFGISATHNSGTLSFVPFLVASNSDNGIYDTLYVDYESGYYLTSWWYYETSDVDFAKWTPWDFSEQVGHTNVADQELSKDIRSIDGLNIQDGLADVSLGGLANSLDMFNLTGSSNPIFRGIDSTGIAFGHIWDVGGHGTGCTGNIAGHDVEYQLLDDAENNNNETYYPIAGIAPGADILASCALGSTDIFYGWLWAAGFEPDENSTWTFQPGSEHIANISSNSWGESSLFDNTGVTDGWDFDTMFVELLSTPGYLDPAYPGVLYCSSSGNGGPGMATAKSPGQAPSALTIGASTNSWIRQDWGYPYENQPYDQIIGWSDNGPSHIGYPKIDVVNLGAFDFSLAPVETRPFDNPYRDGGYYNYDYFGGTSQACPMTAGALALLYDAWMDNAGTPLEPGMAKAIIKSTAVDLGYDVYTQGTGRVDALKMVQYAEGNVDENGDEVFIAYSKDASATAAERLQSSFYRYFNLSWYYTLDEVEFSENVDEYPAFVPAYSNYDNAVYGGTLTADGAAYTASITVAGNSSALSASTVYFNETYTAVNDSEDFLTIAGDYYNVKLSDAFDIAKLRSADFFQISLGFGLAEFEWMQDYGLKHNLYIQNWVNDSGQEQWIFQNYAYNTNNEQHLYLPTDFIQTGQPYADETYIRVRDMGWGDTPFLLSVRAFTRTADPDVTVVANGVDGEFDVTIDVAADKTPGMYEGYIQLDAADDQVVIVPYSYSVAAMVGEVETDGWTEISGLTGTPLDNGGMYGAADRNWRGDAGDWRMYDLIIENQTDNVVNTLLVELNWENMGSCFDMWVVDHDGYIVGLTDYFVAGGHYVSDKNGYGTTQRLLVDLTGYIGETNWTTWQENSTYANADYYNMYTLIVHAGDMDPTNTSFPLEEISIKVAWTNKTVADFDEPVVTVTGTNDIFAPSGAILTNSEMTMSWTVETNDIAEYSNVPYPTALTLLEGYSILEVVALGPSENYDYYIHMDAGDYAQFSIGWDEFYGPVDYDFVLYDPAGNEVASAASLANPESFSVTAQMTGDYVVECEYYSGQDTDINLYFDILVQTGDSTTFLGVAGTPLELNFATEGFSDKSFLYTAQSFGWNFDRTVMGAVIYDATAHNISVVPADKSIEFDASAALAWDITKTDDYLGTYTIKEGSTVLGSGNVTEDGTVSINYAGSTAGAHTIVLTVTDLAGNSVTDSVVVTVAEEVVETTTTETTTTEEEGGVPGYSAFAVIAFAGVAIATLVKKNRK